MPGRYDKPAAPKPSVSDLYYLLGDASPTLRQMADDPEAVEARRAEAVEALRTIARDELMKAGDPNRLQAMPRELFEFLTIKGLRILVADDPVAAAKLLLGQQARRKGRLREDNEHRNIMIAADVAELVNDGIGTEAACEKVSEQAPVEFEMVRKIYFDCRGTDAVMAELGFRLWFRPEGGEKAPPGR